MTGIGDTYWLKAVFQSARFCNRSISMLLIGGNRSVLPNSVKLAVEYVILLDFSTGPRQKLRGHKPLSFVWENKEPSGLTLCHWLAAPKIWNFLFKRKKIANHVELSPHPLFLNFYFFKQQYHGDQRKFRKNPVDTNRPKKVVVLTRWLY